MVKNGNLDVEFNPKQYLAFSTMANEILYGGSRGSGKAVSIYSNILTVDGWKQMKNIHPGDYVFDEKGYPTLVIAESKIFNDSAYKIIFDDRTEEVVHGNHEWIVIDDHCRASIKRYFPKNNNYDFNWYSFCSSNYNRLTTKNCCKVQKLSTEIIEKNIEKNNEIAYSIPLVKPIEFEKKELPIDPWVFGYLLGNGNTADGGRIAANKTDIDEIISVFYKKGFQCKKNPDGIHSTVRGLRKKWLSLNLQNGKYIPNNYIFSSIEQRRELVSGLLDSDGYIKKGACVFTNTNKNIIDGLFVILCSLGFKPRVWKTENKNHPTWSTKYDISFTSNHKFCYLKRKHNKIRTEWTLKENGRHIRSIEKIENVPTKCIQVDSPSHLFLLGKSLIPTHNSFLIRYASLIYSLAVPGLQTYLFRRKFPDLKKNHLFGHEGYLAVLKPYIDSGMAKVNQTEMRIDFSNSSQIHMCHCQQDKDLENYRGAEIHMLFLDESTQFTQHMVEFLRTNVRLGSFEINWEEVQKVLPFAKKGFFPRILYATNPGGPSHNFFKLGYMGQHPPNTIFQAAVEDGGMRRIYVPARLLDNIHQMKLDPEYINRLKGQSSDNDVRAMIFGDWDALGGDAFGDIWDPTVHVVEPFDIPDDWYIDRTFDWGSSHPYGCVWWAESSGSTVNFIDPNTGEEISRIYPPGCVFAIAEEYGCVPGKANIGVKKTALEVGKILREKEKQYKWGNRVKPGASDARIFDTQFVGYMQQSIHDNLLKGYNSVDEKHVYDLFVDAHVQFSGSRVKGLEIMRTYMKASKEFPPENPGIYIFKTCINWLNTVPQLPRDSKKPDEIDTEAEDHLADLSCYRLMSKKRVFTNIGLEGI